MGISVFREGISRYPFFECFSAIFLQDLSTSFRIAGAFHFDVFQVFVNMCFPSTL
eukprot:UN06755